MSDVVEDDCDYLDYYTKRTQPPMLTQMVRIYVEHSGDVAFLSAALPYLDAEYAFWMAKSLFFSFYSFFPLDSLHSYLLYSQCSRSYTLDGTQRLNYYRACSNVPRFYSCTVDHIPTYILPHCLTFHAIPL
jgi:hypothetical protein